MFRVVADGPGGTASSDVEVTPFVIGSAASCDLALADAAIGPRHAQLEVQPDGRVVIRDLGWAAGTYVGASRVDATWLEIPGTFRIGSTQVRVTNEPDRVAAPAPPAATHVPAASSVVARPSNVDTAPGLPPPPPVARNPGSTLAMPAVAPVPSATAAHPVAPAPPPVAPLPEAAAPSSWAAAPASPMPTEPGSKAGETPAQEARTTSAPRPMPIQLRRGLQFLAAAGVIEIASAAIVFAVLLTGAVELADGASTLLWAAASISLMAGLAELVLVRPAWQRVAKASQALLVVASAAAVLAALNTVQVLLADSGNVAIPALRLALNLGGAIALFRFRSWYARP